MKIPPKLSKYWKLETNGLHLDFAGMTQLCGWGNASRWEGPTQRPPPVVNIVPVPCAATSGFLPLGQPRLLCLHAGKAPARRPRVFRACGIKHGESERLLDAGLQDRDKCGGGKLSVSQVFKIERNERL